MDGCGLGSVGFFVLSLPLPCHIGFAFGFDCGGDFGFCLGLGTCCGSKHGIRFGFCCVFVVGLPFYSGILFLLALAFFFFD